MLAEFAVLPGFYTILAGTYGSRLTPSRIPANRGMISQMAHRAQKAKDMTALAQMTDSADLRRGCRERSAPFASGTLSPQWAQSMRDGSGKEKSHERKRDGMKKGKEVRWSDFLNHVERFP
ncbi:hypothetical protein P154DRAFT_580914 [Amniculicola lignicola CBS 123094]|uniref:Uncharacterized protein n=1 Tax=Amniculicola lignicola CBS 123094 TaxID=1392246 RepID=A0A6A5W347_9PLEO|nr:hypothetical protein P154DRAFT_580914 [Amniculicola lignicola CBS 123094]